MASKRFEKGSAEWKLFQEFWSLCQKYWIPEDTDEYWEDVVKTTDDFYKKYKDTNDTFARKIVLAFVETLECKSKEKNEDAS